MNSLVMSIKRTIIAESFVTKLAKFGHIFLMCKSDVIVQWCQKHECQSTVFTFVTLFALFMNTSQVIFQAFAIAIRLFTKWTFTSSYFLLFMNSSDMLSQTIFAHVEVVTYFTFMFCSLGMGT